MQAIALAIVGLFCTVVSSKADLTEAWSRTSPNVTVADAKVGAFGDVYLAGSAAGSNGIVTLKYSPSGWLVWSNRYAGTNTGTHQAAQLLLDAQDNCYVLGQSTGTNVHVGYGHWLDDVVIVKYSATGQQLWATRFPSPHRIDLTAGRIALDTNGNVYFTAIERDAKGYPTTYPGSTYPQFYVMKLGGAGNPLWATKYPSQAPESFKIYSTFELVARPAGGVLVACEDGVLRIQPDGNRTANLVLPQVQGKPSVPNAMRYDKNGNLFTAGAVYSPNVAVLTKYNQEATILWTNTAFALGADSYPGAPSTLLLDGAGNSYAGGYVSTANSLIAFAFLLKCSSSGERLWESWRQMDAFGHYAVPQFAMGERDIVYMAYAGPPNPYPGAGRSELALVKHWPVDGRSEEVRHAGASLVAYPYAVGVGESNQVFLAGGYATSGSPTAVLVKYNDPLLLAAPRFGTTATATGGPFQVQFICEPNHSYRIQASSDLAQWTTVTNFLAPQATNALVLPGGGGLRFYRALTN